MKKQLTLLGLSFLFVVALALTGFNQQEKNKKANKEQQHQKGKSGKAGKGNQDKNDQGKEKKENRGHDNDQGKNDEHPNMGKDKDKNNRDKHDNDDNDRNHDYKWNQDNFKDRKKIKNQDKVTICHKFNRGDEQAVSIRVSSNAVNAHMKHGDIMGECPAVNNNRYSDVYNRNRTDYYNTIQQGQEQVYYSRSILDYALERLTGSRQELTTMQRNNLPPAEIERKQATVVELEQNVSLLETLLNVAATLISNKFQ